MRKQLTPEEARTILKIVEEDCYKCNQAMKIALVIQSMVVRDVSQFSEELIGIARDNGVKIEKRYSNMMDLAYPANICPHCDAMIGMNFTYRYIYADTVKEIEINESLIANTEERTLTL